MAAVDMQAGRATVQGRLHAAEVRPGRHDSNVRRARSPTRPAR
jgi:hypothetical protein